MRYLALACDYDGTLASDGVVPSATVAALEQVRAPAIPDVSLEKGEALVWARDEAEARHIHVEPLRGDRRNGVDDATWMHHLRAGDYSRWVMAELKDKKLATRLAAIEADSGLTPAESRARVRATIQERYAPPE